VIKRACDGVHQAVNAHHEQASRRDTRRRREHSAEFKQELVGRSLQPGVSVAAIAMEGGVNANLLFGWRRKHLGGMAQAGGSVPHQPAAVLLPVSIEAPAAERPSAPSAPPMRPGGSIEIEIGAARVRLRGSVDEASLRMVLTTLRSLA
jgi:transposase